MKHIFSFIFISSLGIDAFQSNSPVKLNQNTHRLPDIHLNPEPVAWVAGHLIGGNLAVPIVAKSIKTWYKKLDLPSWTPPDRVFAPVWTYLYSTMGWAAYQVFQKTSARSLPMKMWYIHFALNMSWAPVFFSMKKLRQGLWINLLLVGTLSATIPLFYKVNPTSGILLLPYLAWLTFATALNWSICNRNPTNQGYNSAMLQADLAELNKAAAIYANEE